MTNLKVYEDIRVSKKIIRDCSGYDNCTYRKYSQIPLLGTENAREVMDKIDGPFDETLIIAGSLASFRSC